MRKEEVKGAYFVVARRHVLEAFGEDVLEHVIAEMPVAHREALEEPSGSAWYPETYLSSAQRAVADAVCDGNLDHFERIMESCVELGVNTFFRVLLGVTTPDFLLRQYPTLYTRVRRGCSRVQVERSGPRTFIHYLDFPNAHDELYHRTVCATFKVLIGLTGQSLSGVRITQFSHSSITASVDLADSSSGVQPKAPELIINDRLKSG